MCALTLRLSLKGQAIPYLVSLLFGAKGTDGQVKGMWRLNMSSQPRRTRVSKQPLKALSFQRKEQI